MQDKPYGHVLFTIQRACKCRLFALSIALFFLFNVMDTAFALEQSEAEYVGSTACVSCHHTQHDQWQHSHHDLSMQPANDQTVLGDFSNTTFEYFGVRSTFYKKANAYYVQTDGPDGKLTDYKIDYTFGVYPLQQYLIAFPKGRYQMLTIAWDSRSLAEGGQRWFHLYPDEYIDHTDELHWTGINQNWNFMCADCHSTNLQKNYTLSEQSYDTTWSEIDVGCEACHGPASQHLEWVESGKPSSVAKGFVQEASLKGQNEIEVCAQCHARRTTLKPGVRPEHRFLDYFQPALLSEDLYHPDGQTDEEVFVYGSFLQSRMFHEGVTCSDCHNPHSLTLKAEGNALCAQCHEPSQFDTPQHHMHPVETDGAQCVNCHMPEKHYMVVDPRRDHSFRIPRPDLSVELGVPNTCNACHQNKTAQWAADVLEKKFGQPDPHYGQAIYAGRVGQPGAAGELIKLILDKSQPAIVRGTAVSLLTPYLNRNTAQIFQIASQDQSPWVGYGLASVLSQIPLQHRFPFAYPLLFDQSAATRVLAAYALNQNSQSNLPEKGRVQLSDTLNEYKQTQEFNSDRPEALLNLASLAMSEGKPDIAKSYYQSAIDIAPYYTPAYINFADYYRDLGKEKEVVRVLQQGLKQVRAPAPLHHSLGLSYVRSANQVAAKQQLKRATETDGSIAHYYYVYAIALNSFGQSQEAIRVLEQAFTIYPNDVELLSGLISLNRDVGNIEASQNYELQLRALVQ